MGRLIALEARGLALAALLCLLACLGLWSGQGRQAYAQPRSGGLQVGLEGAAFKDFLLFMGQFSGKSPVFREDQLPRDTVTLISRQPVSEAVLGELFALVLGAAGLTTSQRGAALYVLPGPSRPAAGMVPTQVLVMRLNSSVGAGQAARILERLRSDAGIVSVSEPAGAVLVRDVPERMARARSVLDALEAAPAGARAELLPLRRAQAKLTAHKLEMYFRGLPGKPPVVLALEWSNSVLLAGDAGQMSQALRLLGQLDEGGREAPALRAFRLRFARAEKVAAMLAELAAADSRLGEMRVRVDAEAGAIVVLAEPEIMARVERLVEDMDQPRPRVLLEAVVVELPVQGADLAVVPGPGGTTAVVGAPAGARAFAQASVGAGASFRGRTLPGSQAVLEELAALLSADPQVRVLARPRAAVHDGGEVRVSIAQAGSGAAAPAAERYRLVLVPRQDIVTGLVTVSVTLEDAAQPGRPQIAEARLGPDALLLLRAGAAGPAGAGADSEWTLFSPRQKAQEGLGRLCIVLSARTQANQANPTNRAAAPARGSAAQPGGANP